MDKDWTENQQTFGARAFQKCLLEAMQNLIRRYKTLYVLLS